MAGQSLQERQRRRQKAVKEPICAARVIKTQLYGTGWSGKLSNEDKNMATSLLDDGGAMYMLQVNRDRQVEPLSLHNALFWEHRQMSYPQIVSTPALIWEQQQDFNDQKITTGIVYAIPFFSTNKSTWKTTYKTIQMQTSPASSTLEIHEFFANIRDREFTIWPVFLDGGFWVTVIMRVETMDAPEVQPVTPTNLYFDRRVTNLAIVDPVHEGQEERLALIFKRLKFLLRQGCVLVSEGSLTPTLACDPVDYEWETGYVSYAVSREFIRRLKVLTHRRGQTDAPDKCHSDAEGCLLWSPFEESHRINSYRESLMSACSNYVIELSDYRIRSTLEVPSAAANHNAAGLRPSQVEGSEDAVDEKISMGEKSCYFKLKMDLPEGYSRESSIEDTQAASVIETPTGPNDKLDVDEADATDDSGTDESDDESIFLQNVLQPGKQYPQPDSASDQEVMEALAPYDPVEKQPRTTTDESVPQGVVTAPAPLKSPLLNASSQRPHSGRSFPDNEIHVGLKGTTEEERLIGVANAAQSLSKEIRASKQRSTEEIGLETATSNDSDVPPTQLAVDDERRPEDTAESVRFQYPPISDAILNLEDGPQGSESRQPQEQVTKAPASPVCCHQEVPEVEIPETQEQTIGAPASLVEREVPEAEIPEPPAAEPVSTPEIQEPSTTEDAEMEQAIPGSDTEVPDGIPTTPVPPGTNISLAGDGGPASRDVDAGNGEQSQFIEETQKETDCLFGESVDSPATGSEIYISEDDADKALGVDRAVGTTTDTTRTAEGTGDVVEDAGAQGAPSTEPRPILPRPETTRTSAVVSCESTVIQGLPATVPQSALGKRGPSEDGIEDEDAPSPKRRKE
ncbi:hypothetical protein DL762_009325 [Monosporascus cannonballus]|uniref:Ubiquitin-like protease family profile domain-containing protein n=1 Tax=Monosporascus cannonballus TaxID=155416 RepID=A0ABY0GUD6_9PEZI|nr:hypothetical protein DL762_009325 [Monosporascus cannonballus]